MAIIRGGERVMIICLLIFIISRPRCNYLIINFIQFNGSFKRWMYKTLWIFFKWWSIFASNSTKFIILTFLYHNLNLIHFFQNLLQLVAHILFNILNIIQQIVILNSCLLSLSTILIDHLFIQWFRWLYLFW